MPSRRIPSYRHYKPKNLGLVVLNGKYLYLGKYGTPESLAEYHRLVQEWLVNHQVPTIATKAADLSVNQILVAYWKHAEEHYRDAEGNHTGELSNMRYALRPLRKLYGHTSAKSFGPLALRAIRQQMIESDLCRTVINARINRVRRFFRWAASVEMIPIAVSQAIDSVPGLRRGRTDARESNGVHAVDWAHVEAALPHLPGPVAAMVEVMRFSNCRAKDAVIMRRSDLKMDGAVWEYRPHSHKNQWREEDSPIHKRIVYLGGRCQEILKPFLNTEQPYLFSPRDAAAEHLAKRRRARKTKPTPSELGRKRQQSPMRRPRPRYDVNSFQQAIRRACRRAGVPGWTVLQIRHTRATDVRAKYGVEGAQASLGNARVETAQIYAERNETLARQIAREIG